MSLWKVLTGRWGSGAGETDEVRIDASTNSIQTVGYQHHEVHAGSDYDVTEVFDLTANQVLDIRVTTPVGSKWAHMTIDFFTEKSVEWWWYEDVDIETAGTEYTPINHRRDSGENSVITVTYIINADIGDANADTDIADPGATTLGHGKTGEAGAKKDSGSGGGAESREEWILAIAETSWSLRFLDLGSGGFVAVHLDWYEHTDKH